MKRTTKFYVCFIFLVPVYHYYCSTDIVESTSLRVNVSNATSSFEKAEMKSTKSSPTAETYTIAQIYRENGPLLFLNTQNKYRILHEVPILSLDNKLSAASRKWAQHLSVENKIYHDPDDSFGENLFKFNFKKTATYPSLVVRTWYEESKQLSSGNITEDMSPKDNLARISNFTQMVWRSTTSFGFGFSINNISNNMFIVCKYEPKGNIKGQYDKNVFRPMKTALSSNLRAESTLIGLFFDMHVYLVLRFFVFGVALLLVPQVVEIVVGKISPASKKVSLKYRTSTPSVA